MHRFFATPEDIRKGILSPEEAHHATKVLRLKTGDEIELIDGIGNSYSAFIISASTKKTLYEISSEVHHEKPKPSVHIAVAPPKSNDRLQWMVEKLTESGATAITFLLSTRSERKKINTEKVFRYAVNAMKQSNRYYLPQLRGMITLENLLEGTTESLKIIATCEGERQQLNDVLKSDKNTLVLIGPEGDFTPIEVQKAIDNNFAPVSFGEYRLRTETAALYVCQIMLYLNNQ